MKNEVANWLKQLTLKHKKALIRSMLMKVLSFVGQIGCFWYFSVFMHNYLVTQAVLDRNQLIYFMIYSLLWVVCRHCSTSHLYGLKTSLENDLQNQINNILNSQQHALAKRYSSFFWQQVYLQYIPALAQYKSLYISQKYISVLLPCIIVITIAPLNWFVATILLFSLPIVPIFMILVGHSAAQLHRKHLNSLERLGGLFIDRLKALTLLTAFNQHKNESLRLARASWLVNKQTMRVVSLAFLSSTVLDFFSTISIALVAVYIGFSLLGELSIGPVTSFQQGLFLLLVAPMLFSELKQLGSLYHQKGEAEAAADALLPILTSTQQIKKNDQLNIEFNHFDATNFEVNTPTIRAKRLTINKHDSIQLTGQSGAGKSLTLDALMGLTPASHQLSGRCVLFSQQAIFLASSIRDNIRMGQDMSDERVWAMLEKVHMKEKISSLPKRLDTYLGDEIIFSGGEAQRLALARVLLQPAEVILLDEPTAHLTEKDHAELAELINTLTINKTRIWASHKFLPTHWFNQKWHVDNGKIRCN